MCRQSWSGMLAALLATLPAAAQDNWPQFRGGQAAGVAAGEKLPERWSTTENVVWKTDVPGRGWSSPVVWGDRVFLTSVVKEGAFEDPKKGLYLGGERKPSTDPHRWLVFCLDGNTGKVLWQREAHRGPPPGPVHVKNTYASETPATDGERVYAYFGNVGLFAYDLEGKLVWSQKWDPARTRFGWGTGASPVLYRGRLYLVNDNEDQSFLACLDAKTGREVWRVERPEKSNWATPFVWENETRTELVTPGTGKVRSYDLDGRLLWELGGMSPITIPTPSAGHGLLFVCSGHVVFGGTWPVYAIRPGASGDISLKEGERSNASIAWSYPKAGPYHPSPVLLGDHLYVLYDRGFLSCYDARTGKVVYDRRRLPGGAFTASPWAQGDRVYCLSEDGETLVIQAGPEFKVLARNPLNEMCLATPAPAGGRLYLRTLSRLYCIGPANR